MRFPTSPCLLRRHTVLFKTLNPRRIAVPSRPASVLSAIHNGLRQSEKSRPQGFDRSSLSTTKPRHLRESPSRSRGEDWIPPDFKIKKGKKDVTDKGPQAPSRRARFNDPASSFGKKSMVYQMKHGDLRSKLAELETGGRSPGGPHGSRGHGSPPSRRGPPERLTPGDFMKNFAAVNGGARNGDPGKREPMGFKGDRASGGSQSPSYPRRSTGWESKTRSSRDDARSFDNGHTRRPGAWSAGKLHDASADKPSFKPRYASSTDSPERIDRAPYQDKRYGSSADTSLPRTRREPYTNRSGRSDGAPYRDKRHGTFADTPSPRFGHEPSTDSPRRPDGAWRRDGQDARRGQDSPRQTEGSWRRDGQDSRGGQDSRKSEDGPIRIHHTTAASQFLYGRSVVEAALKDSRRQLYQLYIYDGDDRQNVQRDDVLARLAREKGIKVTKLSNDGLPMMQKMSGGRPHNGCVVEASPLPQLPLKALGPLSEDPQKPGFHIEMGHQSHEEAAINGTSDFVSYQLPKERKPFVLLLDGILDPGNLGAILRTAAFLGVNGVAITKNSSATLTPVALKASSGASEAMTLFSVQSTVDFLTRSKEKGWLVYAAVPPTKWSRRNSHLTVDRIETYDPLSLQPTVLVVGSEGAGLDKQVRREADHEVSIPGAPGGLASVVESLNVSVATGILCSAFLKKQTSGMIEIEEEPSPSPSASAEGEGEGEGDPQLW
ncbi:RNA methyltransferase [Nemania serpens]|nr:RNA methyltransferase [Nemania serpens]